MHPSLLKCVDPKCVFSEKGFKTPRALKAHNEKYHSTKVVPAIPDSLKAGSADKPNTVLEETLAKYAITPISRSYDSYEDYLSIYPIWTFKPKISGVRNDGTQNRNKYTPKDLQPSPLLNMRRKSTLGEDISSVLVQSAAESMAEKATSQTALRRDFLGQEAVHEQQPRLPSPKQYPSNVEINILPGSKYVNSASTAQGSPNPPFIVDRPTHHVPPLQKPHCCPIPICGRLFKRLDYLKR